MRKLAQKALLLCVSLAVSLLLAELVVRLVRPQDLSGSWGEQTERGLVVNKSAGVARHQFGARVVYYSFTAPHLRAPAPDAPVKVLVLGDSYAFGYLLGDRDTPVSLLQARLDEKFGAGVFSLLNAAVGGWGAGDYTAFVEDFGEQIAPDVILVFLNTDDIGRALRSPLWDFNSADGKLARVVPPRRRFKVLLNGLPGYQWLLEHSHLVQLLRNQSEAFRTQNSLKGQRPESNGPVSEQDVEAARRGKALGAALFQRL
ncbi:MAG TPA: SGNH/GDSL hydrolase family protein, partial [Pyrinomonadaceae bacterium]|nr:SGNH/GDSL hydrolase family protein [Pyrinomonadaceae bacterium]